MDYNMSVFESEVKTERGPVHYLLWLLQGFFFPCWSLDFYRKATQRKVITAVIFLFLLAFARSTITTFQMAEVTNMIGDEITKAYEDRAFPAIEIRDGQAVVSGPQPYVISNDQLLLVIDTSGQIREIDAQSYSEGFLLTRTEFHTLDTEDGYQVMPLANLNEVFGNPIVLDQARSTALWNKIAAIFNAVVFTGLLIWHWIGRLVAAAILGLMLWGIVSLRRPGTAYRSILITGIYTTVPAVYLSFVLKQLGIEFPGLTTLLSVGIWAVVLYGLDRTDWEHSGGFLAENANPLR